MGVRPLTACAVVVLIACPSVAAQAALHADGADGTVLGLRHTFVVAHGQAAIVEEQVEIAAAGATQAASLPGPLWSMPDAGQGWVGRAVAIGNRGTQVFTEFDTAADRALLISGFDHAPIVPVWSDPVVASSTNTTVHGSDGSHQFVSCRQIPVGGGSGPRTVVVSAYVSSSPAPRWIWSFPVPTWGPSRALISADGSRIVAGMLDIATQTLHVAVFDGTAGTPTSYWTRVIGTQLPVFVLSEDGSTVYAASNSTGVVCDAATGAVRLQLVLPTALAAQDISGDGAVLAIGGFNTVDLWERGLDGTYTRTWQGSWPGPVVCHRLDVSEDGSTLVVGLGWYDQNLRVRIEAIDVATKATTMADEALGAGAYQNIVSRVATSFDGQRIAVGLWGDQAGLVPELRLYRRHQNTPIASYDYPGSIHDLAMSRTGDRIVVGTKSVHANVLAAGGSIDLYAYAPEDFRARGTPSAGRKVDFDLWGSASAPARLMVAPQAAAAPIVFPSYGILYLRRDVVTLFPMGTTDAAGYATAEFQLSPDPATIGTSLYFQGLTVVPRRFSRHWLKLTVLP